MKSGSNSNVEKGDVVRVLLVMHGSGGGGVEHSLSTLCKYVDKQQVLMTVALPGNGHMKSFLESIGIDTISTPIEWWTPANWEFDEQHYYRFLSTLEERVKRIVKIIEEKKIDVIHSSTLTVLYGALAARVAGKPHIWNIRGQFDGGAGSSFGIYLPINTVYDIVDALSTRIVANSHAVKKFLLAYLPDNRIDVIHNGVDLSQFEQDMEETANLERDFPGLSGRLKVALVGRIATVKGIEDFVAAGVRIAQKRNDVGFVVVGQVEDNVLYERVKTVIDRAELTDRFVFTDRREDVPALLREIDLLVCASLSEGLPNSCLEAMAASKAVVATRCGGTQEVICDGENGYLTMVGNPAELADAIQKALHNPENLVRMGTRGKEMVVSQFSADVCAGNYEHLYLQLRDQNRSRPLRRNPLYDVFLHFPSKFGQMGERILSLEKEIRDLKSFNNIIKENKIYSMVKRLMKRKYII